jgi:hypothetical protein
MTASPGLNRGIGCDRILHDDVIEVAAASQPTEARLQHRLLDAQPFHTRFNGAMGPSYLRQGLTATIGNK